MSYLSFSLDNIECRYLLTDTPEQRVSEDWFYLIMTAIEGQCGGILDIAQRTIS